MAEKYVGRHRLNDPETDIRAKNIGVVSAKEFVMRHGREIAASAGPVVDFKPVDDWSTGEIRKVLDPSAFYSGEAAEIAAEVMTS